VGPGGYLRSGAVTSLDDFCGNRIQNMRRGVFEEKEEMNGVFFLQPPTYLTQKKRSKLAYLQPTLKTGEVSGEEGAGRG